MPGLFGTTASARRRISDEFYVAGAPASPSRFGVSPAGRAYYDSLAVDAGDEATISVDANGVYLETAGGSGGLGVQPLGTSLLGG